MDERTARKQQPKQIAPERVARMFERLRDGVPDYDFDESFSPFQSSYDNWHYIGRSKPSKEKPAVIVPGLAQGTDGSRPYSLRTKSDYSASDDASISTVTSPAGDYPKQRWVVARVSKHTLRLEREYKQALSLRKLSDDDNIHFVKPLSFHRLPPKQPGDKALAVSMVEAPGRDYLKDLVIMGPNNYRASGEAWMQEGQAPVPLLTFLNFAIGASECCEILHHAHGQVHGEIRSDAFHYNRETNVVKLINFGSGARSFEHGLTSAGWSSLTAERGVEHKLQFIAPEQTGRLPAEPDSRTDIYSLGIIFWTMLTGRPAFAGSTPLEIMQNVLSRRIPPATSIRSDVPDAISSVIQKMTHKSIEDRYNSASGVKHDLVSLKKILTDGDTEALSNFKVATHDVSSFFKLPSHLVGRSEQRQTIIDVIECAARRFARSQPLSKKGLMSLNSGAASLTSSDRLESTLLDDVISDSTSSGTGNRLSRLNSISEIAPVTSRTHDGMTAEGNAIGGHFGRQGFGSTESGLSSAQSGMSQLSMARENGHRP
nr:hypothetical protein B0A51_04067 [Rachicladosporium sp. CCFEE 5018]